MFCFQVISEDEDFIDSGLRNETMAVWSGVTPSGEPDGALLSAMPAGWAAPLHPIAPLADIRPIVRQGFDSITRVVLPRLSRSPSVATTDPGSDAVPGTPGSEDPPDSPVVDPVDPPGSPRTPDPNYFRICLSCGGESNGSSQWCSPLCKGPPSPS